MADDEKAKAAQAALTDKTKQSRLIQFFTTLAGQNFKPIIDAINGAPADFNDQLKKVDDQRKEVETLKAQVAKRGLRLDQIDAELDRLKKQEGQIEGNIKDVEGGIVTPPRDGFV